MKSRVALKCHNGQVNWAAIADIHFGKNIISQEKLYLDLVEYFYPKLENMDILFIPGDIFDSLLHLNHLGSYYAIQFISDLAYHCQTTGMKLRIVSGTYSHDRHQPKFINAFTKYFTKCDYKVLTEIELESLYINKKIKPLRIAYLPDSLPYPTSDQALERIKELMSQVGWNSVDVIVGHGSFSHVLPEVARTATTYTIEQFDGIVDGPIIMGHIHIPSKQGHVLYTGSFERLAHGEEGKKGFLTGTMDFERKWTYHFVENKAATKFITLDMYETDPQILIEQFKSLVKEKFPQLVGHVRVLHNDATMRSLLHQVSNAEFPMIHYTSKAIEIKPEDRIISEPVEVEDEQLVLDLPTLTELIYRKLQSSAEHEKFTLRHYQDAISELGVTA